MSSLQDISPHCLISPKKYNLKLHKCKYHPKFYSQDSKGQKLKPGRISRLLCLRSGSVRVDRGKVPESDCREASAGWSILILGQRWNRPEARGRKTGCRASPVQMQMRHGTNYLIGMEIRREEGMAWCHSSRITVIVLTVPCLDITYPWSDN